MLQFTFEAGLDNVRKSPISHGFLLIIGIVLSIILTYWLFVRAPLPEQPSMSDPCGGCPPGKKCVFVGGRYQCR